MIDFCSAHQKGVRGEARSTHEAALFTRALGGMGDWYSHQETTVIKLTKLPEGYPHGFDFPDGFNPDGLGAAPAPLSPASSPMLVDGGQPSGETMRQEDGI